MNTALFFAGFWIGTIKFLFAHWATYGTAVGMKYEPHYYEIFISTTAGAWVSMAVFYFTSELLMKAAAKKDIKKEYLN